ncbi:conserved hypothetical protein [Trichinella spiralis]|nr:conserved hypothetical protein [Trichinella spiralis]
MPLYRVRTSASSRVIYQCDIICMLLMPKKSKTIFCLLILIDFKSVAPASQYVYYEFASVYGKNNKLPLKGDKAAYFDFNTEKLQKHCCINYFIQGQDIVLKDYSEYPSWLEELLAKDSPHSLSPEDYEYWRQLKKKDRRFKRKRNFFRFRSSFVQRYYLDRGKQDNVHKITGWEIICLRNPHKLTERALSTKQVKDSLIIALPKIR